MTLTYSDNCLTLPATRNAHSHPLKTSLYLFFFLLNSTIPYHQPFNFTCPVLPFLTHVERLYLPCGKFYKFRVVKVKKKNYSNASSIYNLYNTYQITTYVVLGSLTYTLPPRQLALNHLHPLHFCVMLLTLINALMVVLPWSCLPVVTKKKVLHKKKSSFSTPSNVVTLNWASVLDKILKVKAWSTSHTHNTFVS